MVGGGIYWIDVRPPYWVTGKFIDGEAHAVCVVRATAEGTILQANPGPPPREVYVESLEEEDELLLILLDA